MLDALRVVRFSLANFWEELVLLVGLNALWSLAALLPLAPWLLFAGSPSVWFLPLSAALALPLPIVTAGLCFVTNQVTRAKAVSMQTLSLIHISEPTRLLSISSAVFCLTQKNQISYSTLHSHLFNHLLQFSPTISLITYTHVSAPYTPTNSLQL